MRSDTQTQVALTGAVRLSGISCDAPVSTVQLFEAAAAALKRSGFEVVYSERARADYSWLTARSGKRWLELMSFQDSDAVAYQLTDVQADSVAQAAETVAAVQHLEPATASEPPPPAPAPTPEPIATPPALESPAPLQPTQTSAADAVSEPVTVSPAAATHAMPLYQELPNVTPPRPSRRIALVVADAVQQTLRGEVKLNLLVDVDDRGNVLRAVQAPGPLTPDAQKILDPAIAMMMQWRFNPARHNGHRVPGQAIVPVAFYAPVRN